MRRLLLSSFSICLFLLTRSQTFTPEIGVNYWYQPQTNREELLHDPRTFGITYYARLNFCEHKYSSLSIGFPLSVGWTDSKQIKFSDIDIPVEIDYNYGAGSTKDSKKRFGFFVGAGYGFHMTMLHPPVHSYYPIWDIPWPLPQGYVIPTYDFVARAKADPNIPVCMFGPTLNAGFRIAVGQTRKIIEFRFSYFKVLELPPFLQDTYVYSIGTSGSFGAIGEYNPQNKINLGFSCLFAF